MTFVIQEDKDEKGQEYSSVHLCEKLEFTYIQTGRRVVVTNPDPEAPDSWRGEGPCRNDAVLSYLKKRLGL